MEEKRKRHAKERKKAVKRDSGRVIVYTSPRSVACKVLLDCLETWKIPHRVRDIVRDAGAKRELAKLTRGEMSVPVVRIGRRALRNPNWINLVTAIVTCPGIVRRP